MSSQRDGVRKSAAVEQARAAALRGLAFTEKDAADWRETKKCASCHHGIMTAWTFAEARERGYPMRAELLSKTFAWCRERFTTIDQPRGADSRFRSTGLGSV